MDKEVCILYINKKVRIIKKGNYFYIGELIKVDNNTILINDRKQGLTAIDITEISEISEWRDNNG